MQESSRHNSKLPSIETISTILALRDSPEIKEAAKAIVAVTGSNLTFIYATIIQEKMRNLPIRD